MATAPQDGGSFDDLPPLDDEWIKGAAKREESAQQRADRLRRIAAEHERIQRQMEADRRTAATNSRRDTWRPWIIAAAIVGALILLFVIL